MNALYDSYPQEIGQKYFLHRVDKVRRIMQLASFTRRNINEFDLDVY